MSITSPEAQGTTVMTRKLRKDWRCSQVTWPGLSHHLTCKYFIFILKCMCVYVCVCVYKRECLCVYAYIPVCALYMYIIYTHTDHLGRTFHTIILSFSVLSTLPPAFRASTCLLMPPTSSSQGLWPFLLASSPTLWKQVFHSKPTGLLFIQMPHLANKSLVAELGSVVCLVCPQTSLFPLLQPLLSCLVLPQSSKLPVGIVTFTLFQDLPNP